MSITQHNPMHPGAFIRRVYLIPNNIGSNVFASQLNVSNALVSRLVNEKVNLSPEMALKLSQVLGRSPESWLMMQNNYDLWQAKQKVDLSDYKKMTLNKEALKKREPIYNSKNI